MGEKMFTRLLWGAILFSLFDLSGFFRSVMDDLHKLSYSFLDEKRWMEAGDYLTQAIIVFDCLKKSGFQKKDDSTKEENTFLLRAACGLKLWVRPLCWLGGSPGGGGGGGRGSGALMYNVRQVCALTRPPFSHPIAALKIPDFQ